MGKIIKSHYKRQFRPNPYPIPTKRYSLEKSEWQQAICSVCLEAPHNAVLLLCASHDKGCRPYMCGTDFRHSNCLGLFKKAYVKSAITSSTNPQEHSSGLGWPSCKNSGSTELSCPLCRGEVKGWTVVNPARRCLNRKRRSCVHEGCSYTGTYRELKKHVKASHRRAKPRRVDPSLEAKWRALENQTSQEDVLSTIRSSMPGAVVMGDYVIEMDSGSSDMDDFYSDGSLHDLDDLFDDLDDPFYGDGGGDRSFRRSRTSSSVARQTPWTSLDLSERPRIVRFQRDDSILDEDGISDTSAGYHLHEVYIRNGDGWRTASPMQDGSRWRGRRRARTRGGPYSYRAG